MARRDATAMDEQLHHDHDRGDHGPDERWQHSERAFELTERAGVLAVRALEEHVLDTLALRHFISETQRDAGLRFQLDYHAAGLEARVTGSYNPARTSFSAFGAWDERSEVEEAAYQRWRMAMRMLAIGWRDGVTMVACFGQMPTQAFLPALRAALSALAKHYGFAEVTIRR